MKKKTINKSNSLDCIMSILVLERIVTWVESKIFFNFLLQVIASGNNIF